MFETYFELPAAVARHRSAPLARERESFLAHLESGGARRRSIRIVACYLLQVIRLLGLRELRDVTLEEVNRAADHWNKLRNQQNEYKAGQGGVVYFARTARRFLDFFGKLKRPPVSQPFSNYLNDFVDAMASEQGLSKETIRGRRYRAANFLKWYAGRHRRFRDIRITDIDAYINLSVAKRWSLVDFGHEQTALIHEWQVVKDR